MLPLLLNKIIQTDKLLFFYIWLLRKTEFTPFSTPYLIS